MTAISYGVAIAACAVWYGVVRLTDAWDDRKQIKKIRDDMNKENLE